MKSLARANFEYGWRRSFVVVFLLSLIGVLFYLVLGYGQASLEKIGISEKQFNADVLVSNTRVVTGKRRVISAIKSGMVTSQRLNENNTANIWLHEDISFVEPFWNQSVRVIPWEFHEKKVKALARSVNVSSDSLSLPKGIPDNVRSILQTPGYVVVSKPFAKKLNVKLGDTMSAMIVRSRGKTMFKIGAILDSPQTTTKFVLLSYETMNRILPIIQDGSPAMYLIRVKDKSKLEQTIAELSIMLRPYGLQATTPEDKVFIEDMETLLAEQKGLIVIVGVALLMICVIAGFIMRGAILAYRMEFGTLMALGVSKWQVSGIAMEQAFWLGVFSAAASFSGALVFKYVFESMDIYLTYPNWVMIGVPIGLMTLALLAGVLSLSAVTKIKPVELMR